MMEGGKECDKDMRRGLRKIRSGRKRRKMKEKRKK
jgi:hypothetical protein